ncbi:MAG TPA: hypothetical protein VHP11_16995 [Tepidisphaeraceae bacterium]|nr:hypothetical protein [Tepidisphaeraceae bacterium]
MEDQLQTLLRQQAGLRIGAEMAAYLARQMQQTASEDHVSTAIPVIGNDARTGIPLRREFSAASLRALLDSAQ